MDDTSALTVEDIRFHPLSANEWRVSDARFPRQSIAALLGFVAQKGSTFYVTRMNHPLEASTFRSLDDVADHFVATQNEERSPVRVFARGTA